MTYKFTDISEDSSGYDWVYNYQPANVGDPTNEGNGLDYYFDDWFFLKNVDATVWFTWESTGRNFVNTYSLGFRGGGNDSFQLPSTLPNGALLEDVIRTHDNKVQLISNVSDDSIGIYINNVFYGSVSISDTNLDINKKVRFGFHRFATSSNRIDVSKIILYKKNLDTFCYLYQTSTGTHFETSQKVNYSLEVENEYYEPVVGEKIRLYCNDEDVSFDTSYGGVSFETGTKYYNLTTDSNGKGVFRLKNITDTATKYEVQVHKEKDYSYNYSISSSIRAWYRTQPIINSNSVVDSITYSSTAKISLNALLVDNHGNNITESDFGKIYVDGVENQVWDNVRDNKITPREPVAPFYNYNYVIKWVFEGSDLYLPVEYTKTIKVKGPKDVTSISNLSGAIATYLTPYNVEVILDIVTDNTNETWANKVIKVYRDGTLYHTGTTDSDGKLSFTDSSLTAGTHRFKAEFSGTDRLFSSFTEWNVVCDKLDTQLTVLENGGTVYNNQRNYVKVQLKDVKGNYLSNASISVENHVTYADNSEDYYETKTITTNSSGIAVYEYTFNRTLTVGATGACSFRYNGNSNYEYSNASSTIYWEPLNSTSLTFKNANSATYPNAVSIKLLLEDNNGNKLSNKTVKLYRFDEFVSSGRTDSNGLVTFSDTIVPGSYLYEAYFDGDSSYLECHSEQSFIYNKQASKLSVVSNTSPVYVYQNNVVKLKLTTNTGTALSERTINYSFKGSDRTATTGSDGTFSVTLKSNTPVTDENVMFNFDGTRDYYYDSCSLNVKFTWKPKTIPTLTGSITNSTTPKYDTPINIKGVWANANDTVSGRIVKLLRNDTVIATGTTNNSGVVTFSDTPTPNNPNNTSDVYVYKLVYDGDEEREAVTTTVSSIRYLNSSRIELVEKTTPIEAKQSQNIKIKLSDNVSVLKNKTVTVDVTGVRVDGTEYILNEANRHQTKTTDNNGIATVTFQTSVAGTYTFVFSYAGDNTTASSQFTTTVTVTKIESNITLSYDSDNLDVFETTNITAVLKDKYNNVLSNQPIKCELTIFDTSGNVIKKPYTSTNPLSKTTDDDGKISVSYSETEIGNVQGKFVIYFAGNNTYEPSSKYKYVTWNKITTKLEKVSSTGETETTLNGSYSVKLTNTKNNSVIKGQVIKTNITFKDLNGNAVTNVSPPFTTTSRTTNNNGIITETYKPSNRGDIIGTFSFTKEEDDIYKRSTHTGTIKWNKIETGITVKHLKHYAGRYTNIYYEEPDWTVKSPGVESSYENIYVEIVSVETETTYSVPNPQTIEFKNGNTTLFNLTTDSNGIGRKRYTRETVGTSTITVNCKGDDLFKPSSTTMTLITLPRIKTVMSPSYTVVTEYGEPIRYNIPFNINLTLKEDGGNGLSGQNVTFHIDNDQWYANAPWTVKTNNSGIATVSRYRPKTVGELPFYFVFDENDEIDKYLSCTLNDSITVDKDTPKLSFDNLPVTYNNSCTNPITTVSLTITNSIEEPITSNEKIDWYENIGDSYNGNRWETPETGASSTNIESNAKTSHDFPSRSGVRLIRVILEETWRYKRVYITSYINYQLRTEYGFTTTIPVVNGEANFTLDCKTPVGLYDLKIEYVGDLNDDDCKKYSDAVKYYGINRKKGTEFILDYDSELYNSSKKRYEQEVTKQFEVKARLKNEDGLSLESQLITTSVNEENSENIKTDSNGEVIRHHCNNSVDDTDIYYFKYEQTRKQAGTFQTATGYTLPLKPLFSYIDSNWVEYFIDDENPNKYWKQYRDSNNITQKESITKQVYDDAITILNYEYVDFTLRSRAFYYKRKYDRFGEEVHKNSQGDVYRGYSSVGDLTYYIWDGTTKTTTTKEVYDNAERYHVFNTVNSTKMFWRAGSGTELTSGVTNTAGIGSGVYHRHTLNVAPAFVSVEGNDYFDPNTKYTIYLDTRSRLVPILSNNMPSTTYYKIPCKINCIIKDPNGIPLSGKKIKYKVAGETIGTPVSDSNGYTEISYIPPNGRDFKYQCIFDIDGIYGHSEKIFTVKNDKQYPIVAITPSPTELEFNDILNCTTKLYERPESSPNKAMVGYRMQLFLVSSTGSTNYTYPDTDKELLGVATTDNDGLARLSVKAPKSGTYRVWSFYYGDYRDEANPETIISNNSLYHWAWNISTPITINKKTVSFINVVGTSCEGFSYGKTTVQFVDKNNEPLAKHTILVQVLNSSGANVRKYNVKTDSEGIVGVQFMGTAPSTSFTNILPVNITQNNVNTTYTVKYSFNTDEEGCISYPHYKTATKNVTYKFTKAYTSLQTPYISEEGFNVKLVTKTGGTALSGKTVKFIEGSKTVSKVTNSNGIATLLSEDIDGGDHTFTIKFEEDSQYYASQTKGSWTNIIIEECNDLASFTPVAETWYKSSENVANYSTGKLRYYCDATYSPSSVKDSDLLDSEYGVKSLTGLAMKCNSISTSENCDVTFKLMFKSNRSDGGFGGHFGLMNPSATASPEMAPARFEFFKNTTGYMRALYIHNNSYDNRADGITNVSTRILYLHDACDSSRCRARRSLSVSECNLYRPHGFSMELKYNVWYNMVFEIRGKYITCRNLDTNQSHTGYAEKTNGLNPYIFTYLNNCETYVRELRMEQK